MFYNIIIINLLFYPFSKQKNTPKKKNSKTKQKVHDANEVRVKIILWLYGA